MFYQSLHGKEYLAKYKGVQVFTHPKNQDFTDGYDFGIMKVELLEDNSQNFNVEF